MLFACLFFLRLPVVRPGYSLQKLFLKGFEEYNSVDCHSMFSTPVQRTYSNMTAAFTGRLHFTGKKPGFTCWKRWL